MNQNKRPTPAKALYEKLTYLNSLKWERLGRQKEQSNFRKLAYAIGAAVTTYSVIHIFYEINIPLLHVVQLPFTGFYQQQIVPFIAHPLQWVDIRTQPLYESLIAFAGVGASIWANAEFRNNTYLFLYPFKKWQRRPGDINFKADWSKPPVIEKPPAFFSRRSLLRFIHAPVLTYSLLGLIASVSGVLLGVYYFVYYLSECLVVIAYAILFVIQYLLYPLEQPDQQAYWGTRLFLFFYIPCKKLEQKLIKHFTRPILIRVTPKGKLLHVFRITSIEMGRVAVAAMVILAILWIVDKSIA